MLLIGNGRVCTRDECAPWLEDGGVLTDGEVIREVGPLAELRSRYPQAQFIDAKGGIIMPGLINAHTHIYSGLARGLASRDNNPTNFLEVLEGTWWNIDRHMLFGMAGIKSPKIDQYTNEMMDASNAPIFQSCKQWALDNLSKFTKVDAPFVEGISAQVSRSITESTLHGCPPLTRSRASPPT